MPFDQQGAHLRTNFQFIKEKKMFEFSAPINETLENILEILKDIQIEISKAIQEQNAKRQKEKEEKKLTENKENDKK